tara:strand:+ start:476 stop:727 length:252 start_codon:yes stop_codon:yes gene_type:complete
MPLVITSTLKPPPTLRQTIERLHKMKTTELAKFIDDAGIVEELGFILNAQIKNVENVNESKQAIKITRHQLRRLIKESLKGVK